MDNERCGLCHDEIVQKIRDLRARKEQALRSADSNSLKTFDASDIYEYDADIREIKTSYNLRIKRLRKALFK